MILVLTQFVIREALGVYSLTNVPTVFSVNILPKYIIIYFKIWIINKKDV